MSKLVTIYGGSGFVGRYIARRMAKAGWRVRVACRRPNEAIFVRPYGVVGQVVPVLCNIRYDESVREVMKGADAVVNCVGTFDAGGKNNFTAVQSEGAARIARIAAQQGVTQMVHISAIGADRQADSKYGKSKGEGEKAVLDHMPQAMILRPSVVFGQEDEFFNRFAAMTRLSPILPIAGADTRFQPVYVDDVAKAAEMGVRGQAKGGIYELGGPDVDTFRGLMERMLEIVSRRRLVLNMPGFMARIMAFGFDMLQKITFGLFKNSLLTRDQLTSLQHDNIVTGEVGTFSDLGIQPTGMETILPDYLWRFRPSGQFDAIKNSARNLRSS